MRIGEHIQRYKHLPDSRLDIPKRCVFNHLWGCWMEPIYCACGCGRFGGYVPEENCDFAFYLANECVEKWGPIAGTMMVPDEIFHKTVQEQHAQKIKHRGPLG